MVLANWLADWRENSDKSACSNRSNNCRRRLTMPWLAMRDRAYWLQKCAAPRIRNSPTMASGTIHSASLPSVNPSSSKGLSSAGIAGSVSALMKIAPMATTQPMR